MSDTYSILFYLRNPEEIYQTERLHHILQTLISRGYYLFADEESEKVSARYFQSLPSASAPAEQNTHAFPFQPGFSDLAQEHIDRFLQRKAERCELGGFWAADNGPGSGFHFGLSLHHEDLTEGVLILSFDQDFFLPINSQAHYEQWLATLIAIHGASDFLYAQQIDHMGLHQPTMREELEAQGVTRLYYLNIFSPQLVEQLGRERLLSAPAERITTLADGGILLIPCISFSAQSSFSSYEAPQKVAQHLGLVYEEG